MKKEAPTLNDVIAGLKKQYGPAVILTNDEAPEHVEAISTGCYTLDHILGCGGLPRGRLIECFGIESGGKTVITLFLAAQYQKQGKTVAFLDVENAFDRRWAENIGVDTKKLLLSQPGTLEESIDIIRALASTGEVDLLIVDSIAAMTPKVELEGEGKDILKETIGLQARLLGKGLRLLTGPIARSGMTVIMINQLRANIGMYGPATVSPGGKATKFYASVRLQVSKGDKITEGNEVIGNVIKITAVKNKVAMPFRQGTVKLYYKKGIDIYADVLDSAIANDLITKEGHTYSFGEVKLGVGLAKAQEALVGDEKLYAQVRKALDALNN